jgi:hypothetical protein
VILLIEHPILSHPPRSDSRLEHTAGRANVNERGDTIMPELTSDPTTVSLQSSEHDRRAYPRRPVPEVFVAIETEQTTGHPEWASSAIDISADGLALMVPENVPVGSELYLTFRLEDGTSFVRVPSTLVRKEQGYSTGAVRFHDWADGERLLLLAYLARN